MQKELSMTGLILFMLLGTLVSPTLQAQQKETTRPVSFPSMIWVADFTVSADHIKMHYTPLEEISNRPLFSPIKRLEGHLPLISRYSTPEQLTTLVVKIMADSLTATLQDANLPVQRLLVGQPTPASGWLVSGRFDQLEEGETAKAAIIGFGQGTPKIEVSGIVSNLSAVNNPPLMVFGEASHNTLKSKLPGGAVGEVVTHTPYMMAAKFVLDSHATEKDVKALGNTVAKEIIHMMVSKHLIQASNSE